MYICHAGHGDEWYIVEEPADNWVETSVMDLVNVIYNVIFQCQSHMPISIEQVLSYVVSIHRIHAATL
jgi:hypothetical protein